MDAKRDTLLETVDDSSLNEDEHSGEVLKALLPCKGKFFTVGIVLGVPVAELEAIKGAPRGNPTDKLGQVLIEFFKLNRRNPPTWQTIVDVLKNGIHPKLAKDIASTVDCTQQLGSKDVDVVMGRIKRVAAQWETLGTLLGVPGWQIDIIRDQDSKLNRVVEEFFKCDGCTWRRVVDAIYSDNRRHAKVIAEEHPIRAVETVEADCETEAPVVQLRGTNQERNLQPHNTETETPVQPVAVMNLGGNDEAIDGLNNADGQVRATNQGRNVQPDASEVETRVQQGNEAVDRTDTTTTDGQDPNRVRRRKKISCFVVIPLTVIVVISIAVIFLAVSFTKDFMIGGIVAGVLTALFALIIGPGTYTLWCGWIFKEPQIF